MISQKEKGTLSACNAKEVGQNRKAQMQKTKARMFCFCLLNEQLEMKTKREEATRRVGGEGSALRFPNVELKRTHEETNVAVPGSRANCSPIWIERRRNITSEDKREKERKIM